MIRIPVATIEGKRIPRGIFSLRPSPSSDQQEISSLMLKCYEMGINCFDLPSTVHLKSFRELKHLTNDKSLTGIFHLDVEKGASFLGRPLHQFESKILSTIKKNLLLPASVRNLFPFPSSLEIFTQKEIDRISFNPSRLEKVISNLRPEESPFLMVGERYGDLLVAIGRIDLLNDMILWIREKGFIPIFSCQWATFVLPKTKVLNVAAYAIPINKKWSLSDIDTASQLIKRFEKPVISLNPLADGKLLKRSEEAFSFLFNELKIYSAIGEISNEKEARRIIEVLRRFPSLIPHRKT